MTTKHQHTFRVATYNIHGCVGVDQKYNPGRVADVIRELGADVVGLQEVDSRLHPGGPESQLEFLAHKTGLDAVSGSTMGDQRGRYGNALLTRCPILDVQHHELGVPKREPRGAVDVDLDVSDSSLRVLVTHLGLRASERRLQVSWLLHALSEGKGTPLLVLGDFNEWWGLSRALRRLKAALGPCHAPRTYPSRLPWLRLDRIYARAPATVQTVSAHRSKRSRVASDHLPVIADVSIFSSTAVRRPQ